ncbi:trypsin-7 [Aedes albopictus]|uniref:trypsin n=1 Tax=Aedes albopictus TaxID=7160 RepID=A0ABM1ZXG0_AEDAL|nr:trypsin-7-like [Aedes albopictus]
MMRLFISISMLLAQVFCSEVPIAESSSIVQGFDIDITAAPYQISLQILGRHRCGGSIISTTWVLTAAHCTFGIILPYLSVRVGSTKQASGGEIILIRKKVLHPTQGKISTQCIFDYDFSLVQLARPVTLGSNCQIIPLPAPKEPVLDNTVCFTSGWGSTGEDLSKPTEILQATYVQVYNQLQCKQANPWLIITNRMICTGSHDRTGACSGDSGGPLVANGRLIGVASAAYIANCGDPKYPTIYARVATVRYWIRNVANV